ncbi:MAG: Translation initiation factor IF-3 [Lentisphaerae bacterium ADurb.BinA184]|nr:MAG: Translation initiation factor IF-3 [Lentisphaerae bacterium ADurb.BinA184]
MRGEQIRLVDERNENVGLISFEEGLRRAQAAGLDLVEVAGQSRPVVCRIMDYGKFLYEDKKQRKESHKKQLQSKLKEIQFHPNIDGHDYQTKVGHLLAFLEKGFKVKVSVFFRGREMAHRERGTDVLNRVIEDTKAVGTVESPPKAAGRNIIMYLAPGAQKPRPGPSGRTE